MKKNIFNTILGIAFISLCSFVSDGESAGGSNCDLCVVKGKKGILPAVTVFSCKAAANSSCSYSAAGVTASCSNAVACK